MEYQFSEVKPLAIEIKTFDSCGRICRNPFFNIDVHEVDGGWEYIPIYINPTVLDSYVEFDKDKKYGKIIDHIVRSVYTDSESTAIISNYLLEQDNEKYVNEFNELQKIRKFAKTYAKYVVDNELI